MVHLGVAVAVYVLQISIIMGLAYLLSKVSYFIKRGNLKKRIAVLFCVLCFFIAQLSIHPIILCPAKFQTTFSTAQKEVAKTLACGLYSRYIPLFPIWSEINDISSEGTVKMSVHYGFIPRTVVYSFGNDGPYNLDEIIDYI